MRLFSFSGTAALLWTLLPLLPLPAEAQTSLNSLSSVLNVLAPERVIAKRDSVQTVDFTVQVKDGYHVNSNTPSDEYLIPLRWTFNAGPLAVTDVQFPKPLMKNFSFSEKPVSVFEGSIRTSAKLKVGGTAPAGLHHLTGKLRYQACNDRMCLPPRTVEVKVPVEIRN